MGKVSLIFDAKKDELFNYSWFHYCEHPEMKKYLKNIKREDGHYDLVDERTGHLIMTSSQSLEHLIKCPE